MVLRFQNPQEARAAFAADSVLAAERGVITPGVTTYIPEAWRHNYMLAMDAQPALATDPNSAVPAMLTTMIDPEIYEILFSPNQAAEIFGENKKGSWLDETAMFPSAEHVGEVSTYGDFNENGHTGVNTNWPNRQSYLFQTIKIYGERELERAGLARINWVSEIDKASATVMGKFLNTTYFFGVQGLQNYGLLNDPNLGAPLAPLPKASPATGNTWFRNGGANCTANEVFNDIQAIFEQLVLNNAGLVDTKTKMTLAMSPGSEVALTFTNSFNVNVEDLLKKNFPNMTVKTAVQYGALSAANPQGVAAGNYVQLLVDAIEGQDIGYCAFNEKMRTHPIIRTMSGFKQKVTGGTWGSIVRMPVGIQGMVGV